MQIPPSSNLFVALGAFGGGNAAAGRTKPAQAPQPQAALQAPMPQQVRSGTTVTAQAVQPPSVSHASAPAANLPRGSLLNIRV